ncbi:mesoderm posterior protein 1-like [Gracilinanus agilis]|uniref:mesoderm posterior protein 1-like n=1 Tax=Gracilinanus agilis TaxID=191870 RepID=UPI001CFCAC98|nr:mesoderm posterior protein 1-like [Gracilinanus agilis]
MAHSPAALLSPDSWLLPQGWGWGTAPQLPPLSSDRDCSCSPASSSDSWGHSPPGPQARFLPAGHTPKAPSTRTGVGNAAGKRAGRGRLGSGQRQSASEREKLRMRNLSRALHDLRRYLPPSVAPAGQSLTKIETLRLAIRYIGHLSALLGLSEENLRRQRSEVTPRGCPLCPDGLGCCPDRTHGLSPASPVPEARSPQLPDGWESSPSCPTAAPQIQRCGGQILDADTLILEEQVVDLDTASIFPGEVLSLLETWVPLLPQE